MDIHGGIDLRVALASRPRSQKEHGQDARATDGIAGVPLIRHNTPMRQTLSLFIATLVAIVSPLLAEVKLAAPFSDGAVLQRDLPLMVFGTAQPGEPINVSIGGKKAK